jgi:hypothetical protein
MSRRKTYIGDPTSSESTRQTSKTAQAVGAEAKSTSLEVGVLYKGTLVSADPITQNYIVSIDNGGNDVTARWAAGIFSSFFGIKSILRPSPGTRCTCVKAQGSGDIGWYIVGVIPNEPRDKSAGASRTVAGHTRRFVDEGFGTEGGSKSLYNSGESVTIPYDMVEGEYELGNMTGVAIHLLHNIAKLSAGDRAKVECCVLNDMVRIVSENFKHFSAFGDFSIYNDGRLNVEWHGTSREPESYGLEDGEKVKKGELDASGNRMKLEDIPIEDRMLQTGRWRFAQYVGYMGDFINTYVTDPVKTSDDIAKLASGNIIPGKFRAHVNSDGTLLVQSVAEIAFERVSRIVVPVRVKRWEDPKGVLAKELDQLEKSEAKFQAAWSDTKKEDQFNKDIGESVYRIRYYSRWLNQYYSLARYHQYAEGKEEFKIPKESEQSDDKAPDWNDNLKSKEQAPGWGMFKDVYSCYRIMRDGSQMMLDGSGCSVTMVHGHVQVSATKSVTVESAGDLNLVAGNDINMKARRNIEISAITGGLILKARAWWHAVCEFGSMWLLSEADVENPATKLGDNDPDPILFKAGVIIESLRSGFHINGNNGPSSILTDGGDKASLTLQTGPGASMKLYSSTDMEIATQKGGQLDITVGEGTGNLNLKANNFSQELIGAFVINKNFSIAGQKKGSMLLDIEGRIRGTSIAAERLFQKEEYKSPGGGKNLVFPDDSGNQSKVRVKESKIDEAIEPEFIDVAPFIREDLGTKFNYLDPKEYLLCPPDDKYIAFETLSQQAIRIDKPDDYEAWSWDSDRIRISSFKRGDFRHPWPGQRTLQRQTKESYADIPLKDFHKPTSKDAKEFKPKIEEFQEQAVKFNYIKKG